MSGIRIIGMGKALPKHKVTNEDMKQFMDTDDEWIRTRTGISTRYHSIEETHADLCAKAAEAAMQSAGVNVDQIGLLIVATITADYATPSAACVVQQKLGIPSDCPAFDIGAACSGFVYGLQIVDSMFANHAYNTQKPYALLIGAEQLSRILNKSDRATGMLFGDGAGAAIIKKEESNRFFCKLGAKGDVDALWTPGAMREDPWIHMDGKQIFRFAVSIMSLGLKDMEAASAIPITEFDYIVCHQANIRIIEHVRKKLKLPQEKFVINIQKYGNTSGASIPMALAELYQSGKCTPGTKVVCLGFGAGLTWGSAYLEF